jgi:hypothetical protein
MVAPGRNLNLPVNLNPAPPSPPLAQSHGPRGPRPPSPELLGDSDGRWQVHALRSVLLVLLVLPRGTSLACSRFGSTRPDIRVELAELQRPPVRGPHPIRYDRAESALLHPPTASGHGTARQYQRREYPEAEGA